MRLAALILLAALPARAADLAGTLRRVAGDRSPRAALSAARALAHTPAEELSSLLLDDARLAALSGGGAAGRERVELVLAEALAARGDPAAGPALRLVFEDPIRSPDVAAAAARGLGRLCGAEDLRVLSRRARSGDARDAAALQGLASCRGEAAAELIARRLAGAPRAELDRLAQAAGRLGSSWAWHALGPARAAEGARVRQLLASALAAAWSRAPLPSIALALRQVGEVATPGTAPGGGDALPR